MHFSTGRHTGSHIPAITGGELDCCCTPEAFKTGKPGVHFFTGCYIGSPPCHNRKRIGLLLHAGGVQNRQAPACIFLPVAIQDRTPRHNWKKYGLSLHAGGGRSRQARRAFSTGRHTGSHTPAITGGDMDCHCTPERVEAGKPGVHFSTGCHTPPPPAQDCLQSSIISLIEHWQANPNNAI